MSLHGITHLQTNMSVSVVFRQWQCHIGVTAISYQNDGSSYSGRTETGTVLSKLRWLLPVAVSVMEDFRDAIVGRHA